MGPLPGEHGADRSGPMKLDILIVGVVIALAGLVLIVTHGVVFGVNIPQSLGLPCSGGENQTFCPGFASYSIGTVVLLAGLPIALRGLTMPATPAFGAAPGGAAMNPEMLAAMMAATRNLPPGSGAAAPSPGAPGTQRYCPACGQANVATAAFCNRCGKPMPPPTP